MYVWRLRRLDGGMKCASDIHSMYIHGGGITMTQLLCICTVCITYIHTYITRVHTKSSRQDSRA